MRITPVARSSQQIQFTSTAGDAIASWMGTEPPALGRTIDVVLEIEATLPWSELSLVDDAPGMHTTDFGTVLRGRVEAVDQTGALTLSACATIVLVETDGVPPTDPVGRVVQLPATRIAAYPTGI